MTGRSMCETSDRVRGGWPSQIRTYSGYARPLPLTSVGGRGHPFGEKVKETVGLQCERDDISAIIYPERQFILFQITMRMDGV